MGASPRSSTWNGGPSMPGLPPRCRSSMAGSSGTPRASRGARTPCGRTRRATHKLALVEAFYAARGCRRATNSVQRRSPVTSTALLEQRGYTADALTSVQVAGIAPSSPRRRTALRRGPHRHPEPGMVCGLLPGGRGGRECGDRAAGRSWTDRAPGPPTPCSAWRDGPSPPASASWRTGGSAFSAWRRSRRAPPGGGECSTACPRGVGAPAGGTRALSAGHARQWAGAPALRARRLYAIIRLPLPRVPAGAIGQQNPIHT